MQSYEDIFILKANIFYIVTIFIVKKTEDEILLNIGLAHRSGLNSVKFIREYITTKKIIDTIEYTLLLETKEIVDRFYREDNLNSYYFVYNTNINKFKEYEKVKNMIISKSNMVKFEKIKNVSDSKAIMGDISSYLLLMIEANNNKMLIYTDEDKKEKYNGVIT